MRPGEVVVATLLAGRVGDEGNGVVHPVSVVDPGQVRLVQALVQHLNIKKL